MSEAYPYIICFVVGIVAGMIIMWYMVRNEINNVTMGKVKQRGGPGNTMDTDTIIEAAKKVDRKLKRIERKNARKGVINN